MRRTWRKGLCAGIALCAATAAAHPPARSVDLAAVDDDALLRVRGSVLDGGLYGVPVSGGHDVDGDGHRDVAVAEMRASPLGRTHAGMVHLVFGDGTVAGTLDAATPGPRILRILGDGRSEVTGSEIWMDDVTGDGLGDLLVGRQNFRPDEARNGAGALTIVVGSPALRALADAGEALDLRAPPAEIAVATLVGPSAFARLGIWMRSGDVDGDGIADVAVGADQESDGAIAHRGSVYLLRGGPALAATQTLDLAAFGAAESPLAGRVARLRPPSEPATAHHHFGATVEVGDLDGNGRAEVVASAALSRAGAVLLADGAPPGSAHGNGGTLDGTVWIVWDESLPVATWPDALDLVIGDASAVVTAIDGGGTNAFFGEELVIGGDWDGDGNADLFAGDLIGSAAGRPFRSGLGHVLFDVESLRGQSFDLDAPPEHLAITTLAGAIDYEIAADTAIDGDFDGDGRADLAIASPHAWPLGRVEAGAVHVFFGRDGAWPAFVGLGESELPPPEALRTTRVLGAFGAVGFDQGDVLGYSAASGDLDADGRSDLIVNEMLGNGATPAAVDAGTLIALPGRLLAPEPEGAALASVASLVTFARWARRYASRSSSGGGGVSTRSRASSPKPAATARALGTSSASGVWSPGAL